MAQPSTYAEDFINTVNGHWKTSGLSQHGNGNYTLSVQPGRTYDRLVITYDGGSPSCYAFVVRATGELVKSGGWKTPQKSAGGALAVRYDLSEKDGFLAATNDADVYGRFLYAR